MLAGRAASALSRGLGRGGGTVIAGHVVPRLAPDALQALCALEPVSGAPATPPAPCTDRAATPTNGWEHE